MSGGEPNNLHGPQQDIVSWFGSVLYRSSTTYDNGTLGSTANDLDRDLYYLCDLFDLYDMYDLDRDLYDLRVQYL